MIPAAQLVRVERLTPALAPHNWPVRMWPELQLVRTGSEQVCTAAHDRALAFALVGGHGHGDVEPIYEADTVGGEVLVPMVETELGEGGRGGATKAVALEAAATVSGGAGEVAVGIVAASASPDAARPVLGRGGEGAVGESVEGKPTLLKDGKASVGLDSGPDSEGTVVD
ncbi:hypothetical protein SLA2020_375410 [Shorea laevis]